MDRQQLEKLKLNELKEELAKYKLPTQDTRARCIDTLMSHFERNGPRDLLNLEEREQGPSGGLSSEASNIYPSDKVNHSAFTDTMMAKIFELQETVEKLLALNVNNGLNRTETETSSTSVQPSSRGSQGSSLASVPIAQAINLLSSQIPEFKGSEDEDVQLWIQKVEKVSRIHEVSANVTLLAASSKLGKSARRWYDSLGGRADESWQDFKEAITSRFQRQLPYHIIVQRIEAKKWNPAKESFVEYAEDKLVLMQPLKLSDKDAILFLINGIYNFSLRNSAMGLRMCGINQFLREMHEITVMSMDYFKKSLRIPDKIKSGKGIPESHVTKITSPKKINKDSFCVYCKNKGHVRDECLKLKKREQFLQQTSTKSSSSVAAVEPVVPAPTPTEETDINSSVASVGMNNRNLRISNPLLIIQKINNISCNLCALLDTGSPVSFIKASMKKL